MPNEPTEKTVLNLREFLCIGKESKKYNDNTTVVADVTRYEGGWGSASFRVNGGSDYTGGVKGFEINCDPTSPDSRAYCLHKVDRLIELLTKFKSAVEKVKVNPQMKY